MSHSKINMKRIMLEALESNRGIVSRAAAIAGIDRQTHYNWYKNDAKYKQAVDDMDDVVLDFAEGKLHDLISGSDTAATIFLLKTKGKKRGYIERQDIDITSKGESINITKDEILAELELIRRKREETGQ